MADASLRSLPSAAGAAFPGLPLKVRLLVRSPFGQPTSIDLHEDNCVIGTVAGCDLRLPAADLPPLVCVLSAQSSGLYLRKLAPAQLLLVNDQPRSEGLLQSGDRLGIGPFEIRCELSWPSGAPVTTAAEAGNLVGMPFSEQKRLLEEGIRRLAAAQKQLDEDRHDWEQDAERQAEALALRSRNLLEREKELAAARSKLEAERKQIESRGRGYEEREKLLADREAQIEAQRHGLSAECERFREQQGRLQAHYQKKRDFLIALRQSVRRAAGKVQKAKKQLAADQAAARQMAEQLALREEELRTERQRAEQQCKAAATEKQLVEEWQRELESEFAERRAQLDAEQARLAEATRQLAAAQEQHAAALVRLDRAEADLLERQNKLSKEAAELAARTAALSSGASTLQDQTRELQAWEEKLRSREQAVAEKEASLAERQRALEERAGRMETQQAVLAAVRGKIERIRGELVEREQQLTAERLRLDEMENRLCEASRRVCERETALRAQEETWQAERKALEARTAELQQAVATAQTLREQLTQEQEQLERDRRALAEQKAAAAQLAQKLSLRADRIQTVRRRLIAQHRGLKEREQQLLQNEQACHNLQEQLRKRSESLNHRDRSLAELEREQAEKAAAAEQKLQEAAAREQALAAVEADLQQRQAAHQQSAAAQAEAFAQRQRDLDARAQLLEAERQELTQEREALGVLKQQIHEDTERLRCDSARLLEQLPELSLQAHDALGRLAQARAQLREHLQEVHAYARECRENQAAAAREATAAADRLRAEQLELAHAREEHRLALGAFRQQLSEWKGQLAELKQAVLHSQAAMQRRQAELSEQRLSLEEKTQRLAEKAERLETQQQAVSLRKEELSRQLSEMQSWYRNKLRELAAKRLVPPELVNQDRPSEGEPGILPLWSTLDERDQKLAARLLDMDLIEPATLRSLAEAASQQCSSLRDALLDGEYLTSYQLELIEAGDIGALAVGPLRIIDRLRLTPLEAVFRVMDSSRGVEALLRQLAPAVDEKRRQDFRRRFHEAAKVRHPNVAATLEVLELEGRPAALQEWIDGVPSSEWLEFAVAPGVWLRLVRQAADGLAAIHNQGLAHGRLHAGRLLLTEQGELKICGLGEPPWLFPDPDAAGPRSRDRASAVADDLYALGQMASGWLNGALGGRLAPRGLDDAQAIADRLLHRGKAPPFMSATEVRDWIDCHAAEALEYGRPAWEHLLAFIKERLRPAEAVRRQSA